MRSITEKCRLSEALAGIARVGFFDDSTQNGSRLKSTAGMTDAGARQGDRRVKPHTGKYFALVPVMNQRSCRLERYRSLIKGHAGLSGTGHETM
jgi:hypothetical protein